MVKTKYFIMSYNSGFCLVDVQASGVYFANAPSQFFCKGKLGKPMEEIGNLNGFEYMYLNDLKVPYFLNLSTISIKVISMGMTFLTFKSETQTPRVMKIAIQRRFWRAPHAERRISTRRHVLSGVKTSLQ